MTCKLYKSYLILTTFILVFSCKHIDSNTSISLKESFKHDFYIGTAISHSQINQINHKTNTLLEKEFSSITPENAMKWEQIHPQKNTFFFDVSDTYVALGEKYNMHIVGHTLVWHSQLSSWVETIKDSITMAETIEIHINTIVKRYKGRIHTWDVINEALNEDGDFRNSNFYKLMGESYITHAFKLAAKADPDAKLIYNDYNLWKPKKRAGAVKLIKNLQEQDIKIDGVGMQAHWSLEYPTLEDIESSILTYAALGLKVSFTELDITMLPNPWDLDGAAVEQNFTQFEHDPKMNPYPIELTDAAQTKLANRYKDIFKLFLKHKDKIERVTFWGLNDEQTWLNNWPIKGRTNHPLLFDRNLKQKKAYHAVLDLKNK
ncbi:endo-1,4-beta-xylanase [Algibacter pectinivorans]|uniref:Beta-xylanase n=1 Tax=Algibacter pectinivorans TaxID=870482 RepID=A0A1I1PLD8_9FLAO|nr:endo-1,4-beta-xylanase [Algibacter pectinivorans]SFD10522.1 endo-1,4-beta-xylanase [Algibacter pectinivorans]